MLYHTDEISIHKALASLDNEYIPSILAILDFDPQGSREPRRKVMAKTKSSVNFDPQGSREPRLRGQDGKYSPETISIHKALASLDLMM